MFNSQLICNDKRRYRSGLGGSASGGSVPGGSLL